MSSRKEEIFVLDFDPLHSLFIVDSRGCFYYAVLKLRMVDCLTPVTFSVWVIDHLRDFSERPQAIAVKLHSQPPKSKGIGAIFWYTSVLSIINLFD
jgi:hypothetical protein